MSTRGAIGFRLNGKDYITYNHSDSYPSYLGAHIAEFLKTHSVAQMTATAANLELVTEDSKPDSYQIRRCQQWLNLDVGGKTEDDWYNLLREAQGDLGAYVDKGLDYMIDSHGFMSDSVFCEWAYIVNLDTENLEVYKGFNKDPEAPGRYAMSGRSVGSGEPYYGVSLVFEIPVRAFKEVSPEKFVKAIEVLAYDEEEETNG